MPTEALVHPADLAFVEALLALAGLSEMPADAMTVEDGRIKELRILKPRTPKPKVPSFGALKSLPSFAPLTQLRKLEVGNLGIKKLRYDGPSVLAELHLGGERLLSVDVGELTVDEFTLIATALQTLTGTLRVTKKLAVTAPVAVPLEASFELRKLVLSAGATLDPDVLKAQRKLVVFTVHSGKHDVPYFVDLSDHPQLSQLSIESQGRVEVVGNFTTLSHVGVYGNVTPETLHRFAAAYNWDEDITRLEFVVRNPNCAEQTANLIYWTQAPPGICSTRATKEERKPLELIRLIEEAFEEGRVWAEADIPRGVARDTNATVKRVRSLPQYFADQLTASNV